MDQVYSGQGTISKQSHGADNAYSQFENQRQRAIRAESEIIDMKFLMKMSELNKTIDAKEETMLSKIQLYGTVPEDLRIRFQTESEQLRIQVGDMKILQLRLKAALKDKNVTLENFKENGFPEDLTQLSSYLDSIPKNNGSNGEFYAVKQHVSLFARAVGQMNTFSQSTSNGPRSGSVASSLNPGASFQQALFSPQDSTTRRSDTHTFQQTASQPPTNQMAHLQVQPKREIPVPNVHEPKSQTVSETDNEISDINAGLLMRELGNMSLDDFSSSSLSDWKEVPSKKKPHNSTAKAPTMAEVLKNTAAQAQPARPGSANSNKSVEAMKEQAAVDPTKYLRTKLCDSFTKYGVCSYGDKCIFAHGLNNLRPFLQGATGPVYYKVKLCRNWSETGECRHGDRCVFAHGEQQLRSYSGYVDSDAPGTHAEPCDVQQCPQKLMYNKRKTSICKFLGGSCTALNCRYAHSKQELRPLPKYEMCENFEQGFCQYPDDQCVYAHSEQEMREPKEFKGDEADCVICHDKITPHTHYRLACDHEQWHYGCIKEWVNNNNKSCPYCRSDVNVTEARERGKTSLADFIK